MFLISINCKRHIADMMEVAESEVGSNLVVDDNITPTVTWEHEELAQVSDSFQALVLVHILSN